jgi:hypothetical protein
VRVGDRRADLPEEGQTLVDAEPRIVAVLVDRFAFDVLHDEERDPFGRRSAVEQSGDVLMIQGGENLTFRAKPPERRRRQRTVGYLDRDALAILVVGALGEIHHTHATAADLADDAIGAETIADQRSRRLGGDCTESARKQPVERRLRDRPAVDEHGGRLIQGCGALGGVDKSVDLIAQPPVAAALCCQVGRTCGCRLVQRRSSYLFDACPLVASHSRHGYALIRLRTAQFAQ